MRNRSSSARWGTSSYVAIPLFVVVYFAATVLWRVPGWVAGIYLVASVLTFVSYAVDKSAAQARRWRVAESTLLWMGLCGGWPGAILAQQWLRHKSNKAAFRAVFWATVVFNVAGFLVLCWLMDAHAWRMKSWL